MSGGRDGQNPATCPTIHLGTKRRNRLGTEPQKKPSVQSVQLRERQNGFLVPKRHQMKHLGF
jgi:hypothetical protein